MKSKIIISGVILFVLGSVLAWYLFTMKFDDTQDVESDFKMTASQLIQAYDKENAGANKLYSDKIIEISGEVSEIENADSSVNIKMTIPSSDSYIIFSFQNDNKQDAQKLKQSEKVLIKGSCSGGIYSDILEANAISFKRCVIIKN